MRLSKHLETEELKSDFKATYCLFEMGSHYIAEDGLKFLDSVNLLLQPWK